MTSIYDIPPTDEQKSVGSTRIRGTRIPLWVALAATGVSLVIGVALGVGGSAAVGGISSAVAAGQAPDETKLRLAAESCDVADDPSTTLGDKDHTLALDMEGEEDMGGVIYADIECVLDELEAPDSLLLKMGETRSLDGRQSDGWSDLQASWSYHPDTGLDILLEMKRESPAS